MPGLLLVLTVIAGALALLFGVAALTAFRRRHAFTGLVATLTTLLLLVLGALFAAIGVATQGYRALTREVVAATVHVMPTGPGRFDARFTLADGRVESFPLTGDQLYVDAHILKWKPIANLLGLHTAYELDRVGGRYASVEAERDSARSVFSLARQKPFDAFGLRQRWAFLAPLLDAEYGSGTFLTVDRPATLEVRVSTSGLLLRNRD